MLLTFKFSTNFVKQTHIFVIFQPSTAKKQIGTKELFLFVHVHPSIYKIAHT